MGDKRQHVSARSSYRCLLFALMFTAGLLNRSLAADVNAAFDQANKLFEENKFADAAAGYETILRSGQASPALYFNLGNALFKSGQTGHAIVNYLLAEQIAPRDPDIRANLRFARDSVSGGKGHKAAWWQRWTGRLTMNEWTILVTITFWLWFLLLALERLRPVLKKSLRGYTTTTGVALGVLALCLGLACDARFATRTAIIVAREAVVRYGPLDESQSYYTARDGAELTILDRKGDWLQVTDTANRIGWVRRKQVILFPAAAMTSA